MTTTLFVVQIVLAVFITIIVLLQKSSSIGLGAYSGSNESVFGAKGPAGFLAKFTMFLGLLFVLNTIALSYTYNTQSQKSILDSIPSNTLAPAAPAAPNTIQRRVKTLLFLTKMLLPLPHSYNKSLFKDKMKNKLKENNA